MSANVKDIGEAKRKRTVKNMRTVRQAEADEEREAQREPWERGILRNEEGKPRKCLANVMHVLSQHPKWTDAVAYNEFTECTVKLIPPPVRDQDGPSLPGEWTEADSTRTAAWFATVIGFEPATMHVDQAVVAVAERNKMHPVREYLDGLVWDSVPRLDRLLPAYFSTDDTAYSCAVGARWMISAVARVMRPGCQVDCMLVLEGVQGIQKSTGLGALAGDTWFADTGIVIGDKDSYQAFRGKWIYEFGELDSLKGREATRVKNYVSARTDTYRPSYGRRTRDFPRQVVFAGTTNEDAYLADKTGNRRFWPARCRARVRVDAIRRDRDQLWAEAKVRFDAREPWHVDTAEFRALCEAEQAERETIDPWVEIVQKWTQRPTVPVRDSKAEREHLNLDDGVTTADVLLGALDFRKADIRNDATTRVGHVLRKLGWTPTLNAVRRDGERVRVYSRPAHPTEPTPETGCADGEASKTPETPSDTPDTPVSVRTHESGFVAIGETPTANCPKGVPAVSGEADDDGYNAAERVAIQEEGAPAPLAADPIPEGETLTGSAEETQP